MEDPANRRLWGLSLEGPEALVLSVPFSSQHSLLSSMRTSQRESMGSLSMQRHNENQEVLIR